MAINFELNRISIDDYTLVATDDAQNITISFAIQNLRTDAEPEDYFRGETDTIKAYDPEDKERLDMQFNAWLYDYDAETVEEVVEHLKTAFTDWMDYLEVVHTSVNEDLNWYKGHRIN